MINKTLVLNVGASALLLLGGLTMVGCSDDSADPELGSASELARKAAEADAGKKPKKPKNEKPSKDAGAKPDDSDDGTDEDVDEDQDEDEGTDEGTTADAGTP